MALRNCEPWGFGPRNALLRGTKSSKSRQSPHPWLLGSFELKLYLSVFDTPTLSYGSVAAIIVLLMWLYLSGTAVLVGAEVNSIVESAPA